MTTTNSDTSWVIYARISDDRAGAGLGVKRQEADCRALAEKLGGHVTAVCVDNDMTANDRSKRFKPRPEYQRMLNIVEAGQGRVGILAWHSDRLHRTPRELEDFIDLIEAAKAPVHTVRAGPIDLSTPSGRAVARTLGAWARYESEHKADRVLGETLERALTGAIHSGGVRPFGYNRVYKDNGTPKKTLSLEINKSEAEAIRECVRRVLAGHSLGSVRAWLINAGFTTTTGRPWSPQSLRYLLIAGRIAGLRDHHRKSVATAVWQPIISKKEHEQIVETLHYKSRAAAPGGARKFYLSGFVYCDKCLHNNIKMGAFRKNGEPKYRCPPDRGGCNGRVIRMRDLEDFVKLYLVERMSDPAVLRQLAAREADTTATVSELLDQVEADERRASIIAGTLDDTDATDIPEVVANLRRVRQRITDRRAQATQLANLPTVLSGPLPDLAARWDDLHLDEKRIIVALFIDKIVIGPGSRDRTRFDSGRVHIIPAMSP